MQADIYHLYHSGVAVIINNRLFVFDYYRDRPSDTGGGLSNGTVTPQLLDKVDEIFVFVSHSHSDHFNPVIFDWKDYNEDIYYILSKDLKHYENDCEYMSPGEKKVVNNVVIKTYGSTDQGVSFLVSYQGLNIFHAGDLNWWKWKSFSRKEQLREEKQYKEEIKLIKENSIDIAFVPVDPRLEENFYLAGEHFINEVKPELFIPIHFFDHYNITDEFKKLIEKKNTEVAVISKSGEMINFKK
ncbi:MAG: MBL fold metallo-hydrolase [Halanaerobiales bacterium]